MKLCSFIANDARSYGVVTADGIVDVGARLGDVHPTLASALADPALWRGLADEPADLDLASVRLLPPIPSPARIVCVGLNYKTHIEETGMATPAHPILFSRYPDSLVAGGEDLVCPAASASFDFEGELAVVIGRGGRHVAAAHALDHVAGYSCFNDGSLRDFQRHTSQFMPGKNFWRSGSFGPWIVTPDEIGDVTRRELVTRLNGEVVQHTGLDDLLFGVPALIAYMSTIWPLCPGDVIATGTPGGVGAARKPPLWMKAGDTVEVEIAGIGVLRNAVVNES